MSELTEDIEEFIRSSDTFGKRNLKIKDEMLPAVALLREAGGTWSDAVRFLKDYYSVEISENGLKKSFYRRYSSERKTESGRVLAYELEQKKEKKVEHKNNTDSSANVSMQDDEVDSLPLEIKNIVSRLDEDPEYVFRLSDSEWRLYAAFFEKDEKMKSFLLNNTPIKEVPREYIGKYYSYLNGSKRKSLHIKD